MHFCEMNISFFAIRKISHCSECFVLVYGFWIFLWSLIKASIESSSCFFCHINWYFIQVFHDLIFLNYIIIIVVLIWSNWKKCFIYISTWKFINFKIHYMLVEWKTIRRLVNYFKSILIRRVLIASNWNSTAVFV
jgi:hypothetical protein